MSDRGSATANHYDHVHVSVYGHSGHRLSRAAARPPRAAASCL